MKYCSNCGKELVDEAVVCPGCGCSVGNAGAANNVVDSSSFGYALLGFCIPIAGLILWLMWKDTTPLRAKSAGKGALISVILSVVFYIIYFVVILGIIGASSYY